MNNLKWLWFPLFFGETLTFPFIPRMKEQFPSKLNSCMCVRVRVHVRVRAHTFE